MARKKTKRRRLPVRKPVRAYRNRILNRELDEAYRDFCGEGLHRVREVLESLGSPRAEAYLRAIDVEVTNRRAKRKMGKDSARALYRKKRERISDLVGHCLREGYPVFRSEVRDCGQPHILYVYLPGCEQLSWHCNLNGHPSLPEHPGEWDGKNYATLKKLETAVLGLLRPAGKP